MATTATDVIGRLRSGPATLDVGVTAEALGIPRSTLYQAISQGTAPVRVIRVGARIKVLTASVIDLLLGGGSDPVTSGETARHLRSSDPV